MSSADKQLGADIDKLVEMTEVPAKMVLPASLLSLVGQNVVVTGGCRSGRSYLLKLFRAYYSTSAVRQGRAELLGLLQGVTGDPEDLIELPGGLTCTLEELMEVIDEVEGGNHA